MPERSTFHDKSQHHPEHPGFGTYVQTTKIRRATRPPSNGEFYGNGAEKDQHGRLCPQSQRTETECPGPPTDRQRVYALLHVQCGLDDEDDRQTEGNENPYHRRSGDGSSSRDLQHPHPGRQRQAKTSQRATGGRVGGESFAHYKDGRRCTDLLEDEQRKVLERFRGSFATDSRSAEAKVESDPGNVQRIPAGRAEGACCAQSRHDC
eukprot:3324084-Heterocapsa_arctica.AAC.1